MLGVLLKVLPTKTPLKKRREEGERQTIDLITEKRITGAERMASLKPPKIQSLSVDPTAGLCWNGSMFCPATGWVVVTIIS